MSGFSLTLLLQLFGALFIVMGVAGHLGLYKAWYWNSPSRIYGYVPFGLIFIASSFEAQIRAQLGQLGWLMIALYVVLFGLGLWGFIKPPTFLKPGWIRLIETQPRYVYEVMAQDVKSGINWRERVATPEALAEWIKVSRRRKVKSTR
jgi:hypothetical protein